MRKPDTSRVFCDLTAAAMYYLEVAEICNVYRDMIYIGATEDFLETEIRC